MKFAIGLLFLFFALQLLSFSGNPNIRPIELSQWFADISVLFVAIWAAISWKEQHNYGHELNLRQAEESRKFNASMHAYKIGILCVNFEKIVFRMQAEHQSFFDLEAFLNLRAREDENQRDETNKKTDEEIEVEKSYFVIVAKRYEEELLKVVDSIEKELSALFEFPFIEKERCKSLITQLLNLKSSIPKADDFHMDKEHLTDLEESVLKKLEQDNYYNSYHVDATAPITTQVRRLERQVNDIESEL